jgi:hypothetical protein
MGHRCYFIEWSGQGICGNVPFVKKPKGNEMMATWIFERIICKVDLTTNAKILRRECGSLVEGKAMGPI